MGCSSSKLDCFEPDALAPNLDIGGNGVIYSFVVNLGFTICLNIVATIKPEYRYKIYHPPDRSIDRLRGKSPDEGRGKPAPDGTVPVILSDIIFSLCTQQEIIGIAILAARSRTRDITVYHSDIALSLASYSLGTQMAAMQAVIYFLVTNR